MKQTNTTAVTKGWKMKNLRKDLSKYLLFVRTGDQKVHLGAERGGQGVLGPDGGGQQYRDGKAGLAEK